MEETLSISMAMDSTNSKIQQLQKAFTELESYRAVTLNMKWKDLEEHFHRLEKSLKRHFIELEDQEKDFENKTVETQEMLEKREADMAAKEKASLERLQDKRDAAVFAISSALGKYTEVSPIMENDMPAARAAVKMIHFDNRNAEVAKNENGEVEQNEYVEVEQNENVQVNSYPELVNLCKEMDSEGIHKFISDNRKNLAALREEIPFALKTVSDPAGLVLDSLEDFYCIKVLNGDRKKESILLGRRLTCIMLMECLGILVNGPNMDFTSNLISKDIKERARSIAGTWKSKLDDLDMDANSGNSLEAHAFLQLLATFGIASDFNQDVIYKLIPAVSRRRQAADLCRSLGVSDKMPGVIEVLLSSGRQIDAVNLAFAFELTEQFQPVSLLKSYLKEVKRSSIVKPGNASPAAQNEVNERELVAHKAVMKCIEENKLELQYPLETLQKRVSQLEKARADKKRVTEVAKPLPKRPRANSTSYGTRVSTGVTEKVFYPRITDMYPQYVYDRPYGYPENHVPHFLPNTSYSMSTAGHPNYFGSGYQYRAPYLH